MSNRNNKKKVYKAPANCWDKPIEKEKKNLNDPQSTKSENVLSIFGVNVNNLAAKSLE